MERAVEKLIRCYGDDLSNLCDICRQVVNECTGGA
jgi:hypothetical protein